MCPTWPRASVDRWGAPPLSLSNNGPTCGSITQTRTCGDKCQLCAKGKPAPDRALTDNVARPQLQGPALNRVQARRAVIGWSPGVVWVGGTIGAAASGLSEGELGGLQCRLRTEMARGSRPEAGCTYELFGVTVFGCRVSYGSKDEKGGEAIDLDRPFGACCLPSVFHSFRSRRTTAHLYVHTHPHTHHILHPQPLLTKCIA